MEEFPCEFMRIRLYGQNFHLLHALPPMKGAPPQKVCRNILLIAAKAQKFTKIVSNERFPYTYIINIFLIKSKWHTS